MEKMNDKIIQIEFNPLKNEWDKITFECKKEEKIKPFELNCDLQKMLINKKNEVC